MLADYNSNPREHFVHDARGKKSKSICRYLPFRNFLRKCKKDFLCITTYISCAKI